MEYLLVCRSITYAKRMAAALMNAGLHAAVVRTPVGVASESCGYSVKIQGSAGERALTVLAAAGLPPKKTLRHRPDGGYQEVTMP